jgi:hypothetical protein
MAIRNQSYCLLKHRDRLVHVAEIPEALGPTQKRIAEIVEPRRLVWMAIRSQSYCLLFHRDGLVHVAELAEALEATQKRIAEIVEQ